MSRLSDRLDPKQRSDLTAALAGRTLDACRGAACDVAVVTADSAVSAWASGQGVSVLTDPGTGLDAAAGVALASAPGRTWLIVHGDLPLLSSDDIAAVLRACGPLPILAPSHDGGTSVIAGTTAAFPFRYGPGSFRRHLAAVAGRARVLARPGLAFDLDRARDLDAARLLGSSARNQSQRARPSSSSTGARQSWT